MINFIKKYYNWLQGRSLTPKMVRGKAGEDAAARHLKKKKGYKIIGRNWWKGGYEIDIIARDEEVLVFIEVKSQKADSQVPAYYQVTEKKKKNLRKVFKAYLWQMRVKPKYFRFDIVEVKFCQDGQKMINHYENVLLFSKHFHLRNL